MCCRVHFKKYIICIITALKRSLKQGNIFTGVCLSTGGLCLGGLWPEGESLSWRSLSRGSLSWGFSVQGSLSRGSLCPGGSLSRGVSVQREERASYWNALLFPENMRLVSEARESNGKCKLFYWSYGIMRWYPIHRFTKHWSGICQLQIWLHQFIPWISIYHLNDFTGWKA